MAEYIDKNKIPWPKVDNPKGKYWDRLICESVIENMEPEDVIERYKLNKAIEEISNIEQLAEYTCGDIKRMCVEILKRNIGE